MKEVGVCGIICLPFRDQVLVKDVTFHVALSAPTPNV